jgi:hypothetical protein
MANEVAKHSAQEITAETMFEWRLETLRRAGYDERSSLLIALKPEIDLHAASDLVQRGCPVATALRILL